jgi:hypothetical protein
VFGVDLVGHMMSPWWVVDVYSKVTRDTEEDRVPPNCQFYVDDLTRPDWCQSYMGVDMVHVGDTGGDLTLLNSILAGAYRCGFSQA